MHATPRARGNAAHEPSARSALHPRVARWNFIFNASASRRLLITPNEPSQFKRRIEQPWPFRGEARRGRSRSETPRPVPTRKFRSRFSYGPEGWRNVRTSLVRSKNNLKILFSKGDHLESQYIEKQKNIFKINCIYYTKRAYSPLAIFNLMIKRQFLITMDILQCLSYLRIK